MGGKMKFPRSRERGHIEANAPSGCFAPLTLRFRAHVSAATLKQLAS